MNNLSLTHCEICPRMCKANRSRSCGFCGASDVMEISKIMLHIWEEPCISGHDKARGSGAIFFSHCPLGCVYCQNGKISRRSSRGEKYTPDELAQAMIQLESDGAYNINFVSPTHYTPLLIESVDIARSLGMALPIVWNTGGYELASTINVLRGTVDVYLTDFKYASSELAEMYSSARDYPTKAAESLSAMYEQIGNPVINNDGMMQRGVIVRHLVIPSHRKDSINVLHKIADIVPTSGILLSLMAQYTPDFLPRTVNDSDPFHKIRRRVTTFEYDSVADEARRLGFDGFMQERSSATSRFTPDF